MATEQEFRVIRVEREAARARRRLDQLEQRISSDAQAIRDASVRLAGRPAEGNCSFAGSFVGCNDSGVSLAWSVVDDGTGAVLATGTSGPDGGYSGSATIPGDGTSVRVVATSMVTARYGLPADTFATLNLGPNTIAPIACTPAGGFACFIGCDSPVKTHLIGSDPFNDPFDFPIPACLWGSGDVADSDCVFHPVAEGLLFPYTYGIDYSTGVLSLGYFSCVGAAQGYPMFSNVAIGCNPGGRSVFLTATDPVVECAPFSGTWTFTGGNTAKVFGSDPASVTFTE